MHATNLNQVNRSAPAVIPQLQLTTFRLRGQLYGIDVTKVQEVVRPMQLTPVPHAPNYVLGLMNLRGQIATAIGLVELFAIEHKSNDQMMNIVCSLGGALVAFMVDDIGDVIDVDGSEFEPTPATVPAEISKTLQGVYKLQDRLLSVIDMDKMTEILGLK